MSSEWIELVQDMNQSIFAAFPKLPPGFRYEMREVDRRTIEIAVRRDARLEKLEAK